MAPTLPGFQGIKQCVQYLAIHTHKPIFYPSNSYDGSNVIRLTWSLNQVEDHTTQNLLECHQDADPGPALSTRGNLAHARARGAGSPRTVKHRYLPFLWCYATLMMMAKE